MSSPLSSSPGFRYVIFTDLDGTLIDFETYSPELATPLAKQIIDDGLPLVFCSSKTLAEQKALMETMEIVTPCIVENGSGIYLPEGVSLFEGRPAVSASDGDRLISLGVSAVEIQDHIQNISRDLKIDLKQYSTLSDPEIVEITGLSSMAAANARKRDFSETLTASLSDEQWEAVKTAFDAVDLQCLCGGRFYTVTSKNCNKGKALLEVVEAYRSQIVGQWRSVAIGDSPNDVDMLKAADRRYLVQQPDGNWHNVDLPNLNRVPAIGPRGWILAVEEILDT